MYDEHSFHTGPVNEPAPVEEEAEVPEPPPQPESIQPVGVPESVFQPTAPDYPQGFTPPVPVPEIIDPQPIEHFLNEFAPNPVTRQHMARRLRETVEFFGGKLDG